MTRIVSALLAAVAAAVPLGLAIDALLSHLPLSWYAPALLCALAC